MCPSCTWLCTCTFGGLYMHAFASGRLPAFGPTLASWPCCSHVMHSAHTPYSWAPQEWQTFVKQILAGREGALWARA